MTIAERDKNGRVTAARDAHVWHCSLSLHPEEPELADERWAEISKQFVEQMGFAGESTRAQCRWVAIRHGRSAGGSDHAHLVVTLVAEDGSKASVHNDRPRAQKACRELEQRFGLRRLEARTRQGGSRGLKHGELAADRRVRAARRARRAPEPRVVRRSSGSSGRARPPAATRASSSSGFETRASATGPVRGGGHRRGHRLLRRLPGADEGPRRSVWYGGGRLARDLRSPRCGAAGGKTRHAAASGRRVELVDAGAAVGGRATGRARAARPMWHRCTIELERVRQQLRAAGSDRAAIAHAAREGAGVLAAWSLALEGESPARSPARAPARAPAELPADTPAAKGFARAGLALFMLAAGKPDSACRLDDRRARYRPPRLRTGRVHRARGDLDRAQQIETEPAPSSRRSSGARSRAAADGEERDAEAQAAKRAREPLPPPARDPGRQGAGETDDVKRVIGPLRGRRGRGR